jgi:signal transduction histidine kinase
VDAQRLQQVMANFLSNAAKFSPPDRSVDIHLDIHDERVRISVIDHGPGISDEFRARIFQKFSQADASSSRQRGGTGLGLAISKELVERMQGEIGFHSELGQGATFFMSFPIAQSLSLSSSNHNEGRKL